MALARTVGVDRPFEPLLRHLSVTCEIFLRGCRVVTELIGEIVRFRALGGVDLRRGDGQRLDSVLRQPKRLALLAYLALATPRGFHRRDVLLAMFWPEQDQSGARHALRNALYNLRRQLGEAVIANRGTEEVGIAEDLLWCDAVAFERAIEAGEPGVAVDLYSGDLLHGFFLSDSSPSFDHWLERERTRLQLRAADAAWQLATAAEREGKAARAVEMARKALTLRPDDEPWLRKVLALLYRLGDQAGALRTYEEFAARLTNEFEVEPAPETRALIRQVRERRPTAPEFVMPRRSSGADSHGPATDPPASPPHPAPIADQVPPMVEREPQPRPRRRLLAIVLVLVACLAIALFALR